MWTYFVKNHSLTSSRRDLSKQTACVVWFGKYLILYFFFNCSFRDPESLSPDYAHKNFDLFHINNADFHSKIQVRIIFFHIYINIYINKKYF